MPVVTTAQFVVLSRRVRQAVLRVDFASVEMGECANLRATELELLGRRKRRFLRIA